MKWGYHVAADLTQWEVTVQPDKSVFSATVTSSDAFRLSQPALTFVVTRQGAVPWIWPVLTLHIVGSSVSGSLGPQKA